MAKALYRQYRPKTFDEVLGQDRVVNVLKNQVKSGKISHAYLFSGERGTGKTSCAKIFAKAINCLNPKDGSPCLECENCRAIENETTIDVVEMDAASNRRIDDIRNLKDNVIYPPNKLSYKVYIIDEAHMITREAFNALLKIMEEPPSHLVFILATTEIEKVPNTILSRVQKFEFNKIDSNQIRTQIQAILADKNIMIEKEAIDLIIKKANGAMRDALSILDQVISLEKDSYSLSEVESMLGVVDFYDIDKLTAAIIGKNPKASLEYIFALRSAGKSNKDILDSLMNYFEDIMVYRLTESDKYYENIERLEFIKNRAAEITDVEVGDYLDVLVEYSNKLKLTENTDVLTEVAILRMINLKNIDNLDSRLRMLESQSGDGLIDTINKIVDSRLSNINIDEIRINSRPIEAEKPIEVGDPVSDSNESAKEVIKNPIEIINPSPGEVESEKKEEPAPVNNTANNALSKVKEAEVKTMLVETAGGAINELYRVEGFNYAIDGDDFILYIGDDFYTIFIQTKLKEIETKLSSILLKNYRFSIESLDKKDNNISNPVETTEENEQVENEPTEDFSANLREVFGDELIIE